METTTNLFVLGGDTNDDRTELGIGGISRTQKGMNVILSRPGYYRLCLMPGKHPKHPNKPSLHQLTEDYASNYLKNNGYLLRSIVKKSLGFTKESGERVEIVVPPFYVWGSFEECMAASCFFKKGDTNIVITDDDHRDRVLLSFRLLGHEVIFESSGPAKNPGSLSEKVKTVEAYLYGAAYKIGGAYLVRALSAIKNLLLIW